MAGLWDILPYDLAYIESTFLIKAASTSETSVSICQSTRRITEDSHICKINIMKGVYQLC
jgi:hypothetical protein